MSKKFNPKMTCRDQEARANIEMIRNLLDELQQDPEIDSQRAFEDATYS